MHQAMGNISHGKTPEMLELGLSLSLGSDFGHVEQLSGRDPASVFSSWAALHEARLDPKVLRPETAVEMLTIKRRPGACSGTANSARSRSARKLTSRCSTSCGLSGNLFTIQLRNLVYCAHGGCADTVIVDGKILMRGSKVLTLNEHDLYEEAQDRATSLIRRTGLEQAVASIWPMH